MMATNTNIKDMQCKEIHDYTAFPLKLSKDGGSVIPFLYKTDSEFFFFLPFPFPDCILV